MKLPKGTELMVLSYAYYRVTDREKTFWFFKETEKRELFSIDEFNAKTGKMSGAFVRDYPKGHWNAAPYAKQVIGGAEIKDGILTVDTKTKAGLAELRDILEEMLSGSIVFERQEFHDFRGKLK